MTTPPFLTASQGVEPARKLPGRRASLLALLCSLLFLAAGIVSLAVSLIPYEVVLRKVTAGSPNLGAGAFTPAAFAGILARLRLCAVSLLLCGVLAATLRKAIANWMAAAVLPLPGVLAAEARAAARAVRSDSWVHKSALAAVCLLGVALRLAFLAKPLSFDEADTFISYISKPLYVALSWYAQPNNHLFHTLLASVSWRILGEGEWVLRLPAFTAGVLLVPAAYCAARLLYGKHAALIAAAAVAGSAYLTGFSVNARGYTLICLFFLVLIILGRRLLDGNSEPLWVLWSLAAALGLHTIPVMLYPIGITVFWLAASSLWMERRLRRQFLAGLARALALAGFLTLLLYAPVAIVSTPQSVYANPTVAPRGFAFMRRYSLLLPGGIWRLWTQELPPGLGWLLAAGFAAGLFFHRRMATHRVPVILAAAAFLPLAMLAQRTMPFGRVFVFLLPVCAAVSAAGLWYGLARFAGGAPRRFEWISAGAALSLLLSMATPLLPQAKLAAGGGAAGLEDAAAWLSGNARKGDVLVAKVPVTAPLSYYLRRHGVAHAVRGGARDGYVLFFHLEAGPESRHGQGPGARTLVIADEEKQTVSEILEGWGTPDAGCLRSALLGRFQRISIHETGGTGCGAAGRPAEGAGGP